LKQCEGAFLSVIDDYKTGRTTDIKKVYLEKMNLSAASGDVKAPVKFLEYYNERLAEFKASKKKNFKGYQLTFRNLLEFCGRKRPTFDSLDIQFFEDFVKFLETKKDYKISSIRTQIKLFRAVINKAYIKKVHSNIDHNDFKIGNAVKTEKIVNVYLTPAELDRIWRCTFKDHPKTNDRDRLDRKELEAVRDSFIVGCFTGLRFSDW
jgi:integrase